QGTGPQPAGFRDRLERASRRTVSSYLRIRMRLYHLSWLKAFVILGFLCLPLQTLGQVLPGTQPLDWQGDLSERMMDGAHRFVERKISESRQTRQRHW